MDAELITTLARLLSPILSSPDAMRSISSLLGGSEQGEGEQSETVSEKASEDGVSPVLAPSGEGERAKRREALLRALRPYLSQNKGQRLEGLVRASAMLELLGGTGKV